MSRPTTKSIRLLPHTVSGGLTGLLCFTNIERRCANISTKSLSVRLLFTVRSDIRDGGQPFTMASELPLSLVGFSELSKYLMQIMEYYLALQDT